mgnify:CR=1 FL=1
MEGTVGRTDGGKGNLPLITLFFATQFVELKAASAQSGAVFYFVNFFRRGDFSGLEDFCRNRQVEFFGGEGKAAKVRLRILRS